MPTRPGGAPERAPQQVPVAAVGDILAALTQAYSSLTLQCAVSSLMRYMPAARNRPGLEELHRHNYEVSYHLTTAIGSARQILGGARESGYFALIANCEREAMTHQRGAITAFRRVAQGAPAELRPTLQRLDGLMRATAGHIQHAIGLTTAAFGPETVTRLIQRSEQSEQE